MEISLAMIQMLNRHLPNDMMIRLAVKALEMKLLWEVHRVQHYRSMICYASAILLTRSCQHHAQGTSACRPPHIA